MFCSSKVLRILLNQRLEEKVESNKSHLCCIRHSSKWIRYSPQANPNVNFPNPPSHPAEPSQESLRDSICDFWIRGWSLAKSWRSPANCLLPNPRRVSTIKENNVSNAIGQPLSELTPDSVLKLIEAENEDLQLTERVIGWTV